MEKRKIRPLGPRHTKTPLTILTKIGRRDYVMDRSDT